VAVARLCFPCSQSEQSGQDDETVSAEGWYYGYPSDDDSGNPVCGSRNRLGQSIISNLSNNASHVDESAPLLSHIVARPINHPSPGTGAGERAIRSGWQEIVA
jgi:hypothetical protein